MRSHFLACGAALVVLGGAGSVATLALSRPAPVTQPIAFDHKRHVQEELVCADCHAGVEKGKHATFPSIRQCLLCHSEPQGTHPDEPKIRAYAEKKQEIPWIQVNRLPGHVHFSHVAHVGFAKMDCRECHGDMKEATEPVASSQIGHLDMDACVDCHKEKGVSADCLRCHK